ncbi:uncharacterized protein LOC121235517 [Juglans microcarpa x Juglans regia]|uniref:uncharacterized protein LOC121235517 n=1 Tax=Juglans microcarpa x Juglans regia TaxID=2249226 RepID=UPI001B7EF6AA|nr:uncharacterized protein LOC121235517 [Juglans microcarpa x Juglans regia]
MNLGVGFTALKSIENHDNLKWPSSVKAESRFPELERSPYSFRAHRHTVEARASERDGWRPDYEENTAHQISSKRPKPSDSASQTQATYTPGDAGQTFFFGSKVSTTVGGKASLQPKRTPVSNEEIETILLGGCF